MEDWMEKGKSSTGGEGVDKTQIQAVTKGKD